MNKPNATSADVALLAGVSQSTVSRSFDPNSRISEKTRKKVFAAAQELGYQVNKAAQTMIRKRSDLVGLVTAGLSDPFRSEFLHSLVLEVQNSGLRPMVIDVSEKDVVDVQLQSLIQYQLSGVIITSGTPSEAVSQAFIKRGTPVVLVNRSDHSNEADIVNLDNLEAGRLAAQALLKAGKKRLCVVRSKVQSYSSLKRAEGFVEGLAPFVESNQIYVEERFCDAGSYEGGAHFAKQWLKEPNKSDGIFFCMDHIACGFIDGLRKETAIRTPEDIAIVGCDDIALSRYQAYDLTTVRQSADKMAVSAVQTLKNRLETPEASPQKLIIPVEMIFRSTLPKF